MAELRETHTIFGPFVDWDPVDMATLFLRTNGYSVTSSEKGERPPALERLPAAKVETSESVEEAEPEGRESTEEGGADAHEDAAETADADAPGTADADELEDTGEQSDDEGIELSDEGASLSDVVEPPAEAPPDEVVRLAEAERGASSAGWFSSNLAELHTRVTVELEANRVNVTYVVNTTGQHLWAEEKEFWKREADALRTFLTTHSETIPSVLEAEKDRAYEVRKEFVRFGCMVGFLVGLGLFVFLMAMFR